MKTIKIKYLLGAILSGLFVLISAQQPEKYSIAIPIIFGVLFILSISLLVSDRYTHAVTDEKGNVIAKFENEKSALEFADNQARNVKVLMMHLQ